MKRGKLGEQCKVTEKLATIAFDADDTLWHNEEVFRLTQERFTALLADFTDSDHLAQRLLSAERRNLGHYGYGVKGFVLSMIETAIEVTDGAVPASVINEIILEGRSMLDHPIQLLPHAQSVVTQLSQRFQVLLITKGDLMDQERKLAQSGLGDLFDGVEIVSEKTPEVYGAIFLRHGTTPDRSMMVGNSLKSDVNPAIAAGAWGVHVPHDLTWELEHAPAPSGHARFRQLETLAPLTSLVDKILNS